MSNLKKDILILTLLIIVSVLVNQSGNHVFSFGLIMTGGVLLISLPIILIIYIFKHLKKENCDRPIHYINYILIVFIFLIGVPKVIQMFNTPTEDVKKEMTLEEVSKISNNAIDNEIAKKGLNKFAKDMVVGLNKRVKANGGYIDIDAVTKQVYGTSRDNHVVFKYEINRKLYLDTYKNISNNTNEIIKVLTPNLQKSSINSFCSFKAYRRIMQKGIVFEQVYMFDDASFMLGISIDDNKCIRANY